jgi:hypothetical protein
MSAFSGVMISDIRLHSRQVRRFEQSGRWRNSGYSTWGLEQHEAFTIRVKMVVLLPGGYPRFVRALLVS